MISDPYSHLEWLLGFNNRAIATMMTVGVDHSRRYCNTGYGHWPVSRTETFNTQVHWLNLPKIIHRPQPTVTKLIRTLISDREAIVAPGVTSLKEKGHDSVFLYCFFSINIRYQVTTQSYSTFSKPILCGGN